MRIEDRGAVVSGMAEIHRGRRADVRLLRLRCRHQNRSVVKSGGLRLGTDIDRRQQDQSGDRQKGNEEFGFPHNSGPPFWEVVLRL